MGVHTVHLTVSLAIHGVPHAPTVTANAATSRQKTMKRSDAAAQQAGVATGNGTVFP